MISHPLIPSTLIERMYISVQDKGTQPAITPQVPPSVDPTIAEGMSLG